MGIGNNGLNGCKAIKKITPTISRTGDGGNTDTRTTPTALQTRHKSEAFQRNQQITRENYVR